MDPGSDQRLIWLDKKPESVGIPMPNTEVYVVDDEGNIKGRNAQGQLVVRGSNIKQGYWRDPEATAEVLRPGRFP